MSRRSKHIEHHRKNSIRNSNLFVRSVSRCLTKPNLKTGNETVRLSVLVGFLELKMLFSTWHRLVSRLAFTLWRVWKLGLDCVRDLSYAAQKWQRIVRGAHLDLRLDCFFLYMHSLPWLMEYYKPYQCIANGPPFKHIIWLIFILLNGKAQLGHRHYKSSRRNSMNIFSNRNRKNTGLITTEIFRIRRILHLGAANVLVQAFSYSGGPFTGRSISC